MLAKGAVSWFSWMQTVTASGTSEAGYIALSEAVKELLFSRQVQGFMVQDFMKPSMRILHVRRRTKHIDVIHDLGTNANDARNVRVMYVRTEYQHADLFTKPLDIRFL